jgi:hypothetical protein
MRVTTRRASVDGKSRPIPILAQRASEDLQQLEESFNRVKAVIPNIQKGLDATQIYLNLIEKRGDQTTPSSIQGSRSHELTHAKNVYVYFKNVVTALENCLELLDLVNDNKLRIAAVKLEAAFDPAEFAKVTQCADVDDVQDSHAPMDQTHSSQTVHDASLKTSDKTIDALSGQPSARRRQMFSWLTYRRKKTNGSHTSTSL